MYLKLLLLILVFLSLFVCAQSHVVFCPMGSVWTSIHTSGYPNQTLKTESVHCTGIQIIGSDTVKVLTHQRFFLWTDYSADYGNITPTYLKQKGDTVFIKNNRTQNNWQVLYNYAAQTGDVWLNNILRGSITNPVNVTYTTQVLSTQTVTINGQPLKQLSVLQYCSINAATSYSYTITERLGSSSFFFPFGGTFNQDNGFFVENLCYSDSTFGAYQYSNKSCDYALTLGLNETNISEASITLFPNPTNKKLGIYFSGAVASNNYSYTILNTLGEKVKEGSLNFQEMQADINTENLTNGIYILKIQGSESSTKSVSKRFVKTN